MPVVYCAAGGWACCIPDTGGRWACYSRGTGGIPVVLGCGEGEQAAGVGWGAVGDWLLVVILVENYPLEPHELIIDHLFCGLAFSLGFALAVYPQRLH